MAGIDVQQFISSHRAKLNQERSRMMDERAPRGILPSGSNSTDHATTLRRERETEYQDYLKTQGPVKSKSISDIRRDMAYKRDSELSSHSDTNLVRDRDRGLDYGSMKERKMAEERSYRSDGAEPRRRWEDSKPSVSFKRVDQYGKNGDWDSEEKELVSWARQKHNTRSPSPPSHRTISAPTHTVGGITTLGVGDNDREAKRNRQKEYAESLRAQMKEKNGLSEPPPKQQIPRKQFSPEKMPPRARSQPQHDPRRPPSMNEQHYPPHPSMYQHYPPPPPPPPHPYYMPHSYYPPQPPRDMYYQDRPDPYRYPYYPPPQEYSNPYLPPNVPAHMTRHRDEWAEPLKQREREPEMRRSDERKENRTKYDSDTSPIHGSSTKSSKIDKKSYRRELEKQMKEKKERELKTKIEKEKYELRREVEIYDPFGKGGCGAPVRDQSGNIVADLKKLKRINDDRSGTTPRHSQEFANTDNSPLRRSYEGSPQHSSKTVLTYGKMDDEFQKKGDQESYRDYLRRQVQEKEDRKRKEKEAEKLQELKEIKRLENDSLKLANNLKKERESERLTEVALKRKNEELKKEAEIRRKELIIKQRELLHKEQQQEQLLAEQKMQNLVDKMAQPVNPMLQPRSSSPPIPTVRKKLNQQGGIPQHQGEIPQQPSSQHTMLPPPPSSPPVPTIQRNQARQTVPTPVPTAPIVQQRSEATPIPASESSILTQLAAMRMHLQAQLSDQMKTSRLTQPQPAPNYTVPAPRASAGPRVRQPQNSALNANVEQFSSLKYKNPHSELLSQFPNPPRTESALEVQQGAMLRYQEERLAGMRNREKKPAPVVRGQLPSFSEGVPLSSADPFLQEDPRPSHARDLDRGQPSGVRNKSAGGQSQFSVATLDVDGMAGRNEERMRRLDAILNAGTHTGSSRGVGGHSGVGGPSRGVRGVEPGEDSESIISNFLNRREPGRPSLTRGSEMSLECETAYQRLGTPSN